ncbi:interferon-inducible GTPase 1-like [Cyprinus carpio]|uniref:Interferon-inducible GTPase 1-like n=1 Tax=Cyprinus carpio TaxID=7962 RepID=A0A9Q9YY13_CYPCA|nr:interferon-inducible GTPase 1-like [Cyprinus carpio]
MDDGFLPAKIQEDYINKIKNVFASESPEEIPHQLISLLEVFDRLKIDIAVTGESGAGKSSLINAFLGLNPDDAGAAPTGAVETTKEATMYQHPNFPHVRLWDLPGMGTPSFESKSYVKTMNFDLYDMFMVVISERVRENNMLLVEEIEQQKKPYYFIRTKIDNDIQSQRKKKKFSEIHVLDQMRQDCKKYLKEKKLDPHVFLVSAIDTQKYELQKLTDTLKDEVSQLRAEVFSSFLDEMLHGRWIKARYATNHIQQTRKLQAEDITTLQNMHKRTGFGAAKVSVVLEALSHFQLDVAVLGETGSGVSTFVNALIGLGNEECGAASASISNPAMSLGYPDVRFWDISGIEGVMDYSMYEMKQALNCYDFFIIIVSDWQKARHLKLAKAVEELRKHYLLVQTKVDRHLQTQKSELCCDETEILDGLRAQYTQELQMAKLSEEQIFLINNLDRCAFDFVVLESALSSDLKTVRTSAFAYYIANTVKEHK